MKDNKEQTKEQIKEQDKDGMSINELYNRVDNINYYALYGQFLNRKKLQNKDDKGVRAKVKFYEYFLWLESLFTDQMLLFLCFVIVFFIMVIWFTL